MAYKIDEIEGIGPAFAEKLQAAGIKTTEDLLSHCCEPKGRDRICQAAGVSATQLLKWVNMADLMRISGIAGEFAELLEASGVDTVKELGTRNAGNLAEKMQQVNEVKKLTRTVPSSTTIEKWIEQARGVEPLIKH